MTVKVEKGKVRMFCDCGCGEEITIHFKDHSHEMGFLANELQKIEIENAKQRTKYREMLIKQKEKKA